MLNYHPLTNSYITPEFQCSVNTSRKSGPQVYGVLVVHSEFFSENHVTHNKAPGHACSQSPPNTNYLHGEIYVANSIHTDKPGTPDDFLQCVCVCVRETVRERKRCSG